jgi:hypothetical protein
MKVGNARAGFSDNVCMPLRLVIPLPGPFVYVSGGKKRRNPNAPLGPGFWTTAVLAVASLGYGMLHVWWISATVGVLVAAAVVVAVLRVPKGQRRRIPALLWAWMKRKLYL